MTKIVAQHILKCITWALCSNDNENDNDNEITLLNAMCP